MACIDTDEPELFRSLSPVLQSWGFTVLDAASVASEHRNRVPRIVHHSSATRTVVTATNLLRAGVAPGIVCALVDSIDSLHALAAVSGRASWL